jgi:hypothetical protein
MSCFKNRGLCFLNPTKRIPAFLRLRPEGVLVMAGLAEHSSTEAPFQIKVLLIIPVLSSFQARYVDVRAWHEFYSFLDKKQW